MIMFNNIVFVKKEILYFGKKETHNVLCVEKLTDTGKSFYVPLTYSSKGKDDKYYNQYIVNDNIDEIVVANLLDIYKECKIETK